MVFDLITKLLLSPVYYVFHHNYLFGFIHKQFIKKFYYQNLKFELKIKNIPIQNYASFLFKTYEYNDRKLIENYISKKNKSIILGGGIGFIPALTYEKSKNKVLIFEVNPKIINNLKKNLEINRIKFKIFNKNLVFTNEKNKKFYLSKDFLSTSSNILTSDSFLADNIKINKIKSFKNYNTMILDIEGGEEYIIKNIKKLNNIKYLFFELHHNIITKNKIKNLFKILKRNKYHLMGKCFNSYYFKAK